MIESKLIQDILEESRAFRISLGDDLYIQPENSGYVVNHYGLGTPPSYESVLITSDFFSKVSEAAEEMVSIRHQKKYGFDYERARLGREDDD